VSRRPSLQLIFAITLTGILNNTLVTPAIPDILEDLGVPTGRSGILVAAGSLAGIVLAPVIGLLADRFGRRIVLTTCLVIFGTFGLGGALAPTFELLLASRFFQGVGSAGLINLAVVLIGDHWSGLERTKIVGRNSAVLTVGLAALPLLSGTITELVGWRAAFSIYTLAFGTAGWVWLSLERYRPAEPPSLRDQLSGAGEVVRTPVIAMSILSGFFVFVAIFGLMLTVLPVYLAERFGLGASARGLLISLPALTSTLTAFNQSRIRALIPTRTVVVGSSLGLVAAFLTLGLAGSIVVVAVGALVYGASEGALIPTLQDVNVSAAPEDHRGAAVAVWVGAARLGQTSGALIAGVGIAVLGSQMTLVIGSSVAAAIVLIGWFGPFARTVSGARPVTSG
jgi:MFS family permease